MHPNPPPDCPAPRPKPTRCTHLARRAHRPALPLSHGRTHRAARLAALPQALRPSGRAPASRSDVQNHHRWGRGAGQCATMQHRAMQHNRRQGSKAGAHAGGQADGHALDCMEWAPSCFRAELTPDTQPAPASGSSSHKHPLPHAHDDACVCTPCPSRLPHRPACRAGWGRNSANNVPRLKPEVLRLLQQELGPALALSEPPGNTGVYWVAAPE